MSGEAGCENIRKYHISFNSKKCPFTHAPPPAAVAKLIVNFWYAYISLICITAVLEDIFHSVLMQVLSEGTPNWSFAKSYIIGKLSLRRIAWSKCRLVIQSGRHFKTRLKVFSQILLGCPIFGTLHPQVISTRNRFLKRSKIENFKVWVGKTLISPQARSFIKK